MPNRVLKRIIKPTAFKFIAGNYIEDALQKAKSLNKKGFPTTISRLGESSHIEEQARHNVIIYKLLINTINSENINSGLSIKLSSLSAGSIPCNIVYSYFQEIAELAKLNNVFIRIDMERSPYIDESLRLYHYFRESYNIGITLQACLKRTQEDIKNMPHGCNIRLCKGAYRESRSISYRSEKKIRELFVHHLDQLIQKQCKVAIATHDSKLLTEIKYTVLSTFVREYCEFQMLYGHYDKALDLQENGYGVRIYIPYGHDWYQYCMRRLGENPRMIWRLLRR